MNKLLDGLKENMDKLKNNKKSGKSGKGRKPILKIVLILIVLAAAAIFILNKRRAASADTETISGGSIGTVMRGSISNELTSSGTLSPKDTYTITSLVTGEIISADFEEGDQVTKGQTLFVIDQSDISSDIESAERTLQSAQSDFESAEETKAKSLKQLNNGTILSTSSGYVKEISIGTGDSVGSDSTVATLYNDSQMYFRVAFLESDANALSVGQDISVELNDTGEQIPGVIMTKSDLTETLDGGIPVKYVEIYVTNPGGLTSSDTANAFVGDIRSLTSGAFEAMEEFNLKIELPQSLKVQDVLISEGQYVSVGTPVFTATADSLSDAIKAVNKTYDSAETTLKNAENQRSKLDDTIDKYTITAPISGQVITKNVKTGDNINSQSSTTTTLALIYDLSELTFEMSIDELDISKVKTGQTVVVTADAFENETYTGHVTNVSLKGTASNGVTTYPVVVTLDETGDLLPGMNVSGVIKLEESEDTLYIPSGALQRGNTVYVKDDSAGTGTGTDIGSGSGGSDPDGAGSARPDSEETGQAAGDTSVSKPDSSSVPSGDSGDGEIISKDTKPAGETEGKNGPPADTASNGSDTAASGMSFGDAPEGFTAVTVTTGIISDDYVEILSGLNEGQQVYVKDSVSTDSWMMGGFDMGGGPGGGGPDGGGPGGPG